MDAKYIEQFLKTHGIKPSHHRMRVYQYLLENRNHPSIDVLYHDLIQEIPTLSKTTLYNTMNLFLAKGIVIVISIVENEMHYDADTSLHGHFKCNNCGKIYDIALNITFGDEDGLAGFAIHENHIYFKGLCPTCIHSSTNRVVPIKLN